MKKLILLIISIATIAVLLCACDYDGDEPSITDSGIDTVNNITGVSLEVKTGTLSADGLVVIVRNKSNSAITFGSSYSIETEADGKWQQFPLLVDGEIQWTEEVYYVLAGCSFEFEPVNWVWLYGSLPAGSYRFNKEGLVESEGNAKKHTFSVEFSIRDNEPVAAASQAPTNTNWHEITGREMEESVFADTLDTEIMEFAALNLQSLTNDIGKKEREEPESVLRGDWAKDFPVSEQYKTILDIGLPAIKPLYYILYKSGEAGLYEYLICSAIEEITGYRYFYDDSYGWANAYEFRQAYNNKVKDTIARFYEVLESGEAEERKSEEIAELGIFAVAPLLNELDTADGRMSKDAITECVRLIVGQHTGHDILDNVDIWRASNEKSYRNVIEILEINTLPVQ